MTDEPMMWYGEHDAEGRSLPPRPASPASLPPAPPTLLSEAECEAMRPRYEHFSEVLKLLATVAALRAEVAALRAKCDALDDALADETERPRAARSSAAGEDADG